MLPLRGGLVEIMGNAKNQNLSVRGGTIMCFDLCTVGFGMFVNIYFFLSIVGFCHNITSFLCGAIPEGLLNIAQKHNFWN